MKTMAEYIKREDAIKIAEKYGLANGSVLGRHTGLADCIASEISAIPTADVGKVETRQERFLEMFPHTVKTIADDVDVIDLCPGRLGERRRCPTDYDCGKCKREFWFAKEDSHD